MVELTISRTFDAPVMMPPVTASEVDAVSVVKVPAALLVPPIAGGLANKLVNPVPLTVLLADSVVAATDDAVVEPIGVF